MNRKIIAGHLLRIAEEIIASDSSESDFVIISNSRNGKLRLNILKKEMSRFYNSDEWKKISMMFSESRKSSPIGIDKRQKKNSPKGDGFSTVDLTFSNTAMENGDIPSSVITESLMEYGLKKSV